MTLRHCRQANLAALASAALLLGVLAAEAAPKPVKQVPLPRPKPVATPPKAAPVAASPKAARLRIIVGAEPRLPAIAISPHSRKETTMPTTATSTPCQKEIPK